MSYNYQHSTVAGESWVRAKRIVIENELGKSPKIKFVEEKVVNTDNGDKFSKDKGVLDVNATDELMTEMVEIKDPVTGEPTGESVSFGHIYTLLKSTYLHFSHLRDNPPPPPTPEPITEEELMRQEGGV